MSHALSRMTHNWCLMTNGSLLFAAITHLHRIVPAPFRAQHKAKHLKEGHKNGTTRLSNTCPFAILIVIAHQCCLDAQEVEYVKAEDKLARIGVALQKTPPPVLIFAERTRDVDAVHEHLLLQGVDAVAIHGACTYNKVIKVVV